MASRPLVPAAVAEVGRLAGVDEEGAEAGDGPAPSQYPRLEMKLTKEGTEAISGGALKSGSSLRLGPVTQEVHSVMKLFHRSAACHVEGTHD